MMNGDTLRLGHLLGTRLRPFALAAGILISLGLPATYYVLRQDDLHREAQRHADDLAERLRARAAREGRDVVAWLREPADRRGPALKPLLAEFLPDRSVIIIHVIDDGGREIDAYHHGRSAEGWWERAAPVGRAALAAQAGAPVVTVAVAPGRTLAMTAVLLVLSSIVGIGIASIIYVYPVRVARGTERQIDDVLARQESLLEAGRLLASSLDLREVLDRLTEIARSLPGIDVVRIWLRDEASGDLLLHSQSGVRRLDVDARRRLGAREGITAVVVNERRPLVLRDTLNDPRLVNTAWFRAEGLASFLGVPLRIGDDCVGVLACMSRAPRDWSAAEIGLAETLGTLAAVAIGNASLFGETESRRRTAEALAEENARLYAEATRRRQEAEALARITRDLTETLDVTQLGRRVVDDALPLFAARSSSLLMLEPDRSLRVVAWGGAAADHVAQDARFPAGSGVIGRAAASGAALQSRDVLSDPTIVLTDEMRAMHVAAGDRAVLAVPLRIKGQVAGVLAITDGALRDFDEGEVRLLQTFAEQAALALENARLYEHAQRAYRDLSETQAHLVRGETLRAMGELASGVAHHINNLLAVVVGRLQLARARKPPFEIDRHLELAARAASDGAEVVRRMSRFCRGQPSQDLGPVDLNAVAADVLELTRPRWQDEAQVRGIRVEARLAPGTIPEVLGDASALRETMMNLVLNAVDALPEGGTITIRTWAGDGVVNCEVADTGIGMTPEVQRRALEPFFTTKGFHSTGLGLSVDYGIIQRHGGELTIESAPNEGTRVTFRLPIAPARPPEAEETPPATPPLRILVIDDEAEVRAVLVETLTELGHEVVEASSGPDGLAYLVGHGVFDLVLTDLGMPGMTGWEVVRAVKASRSSLRVGLVTGWSEPLAGKTEDGASPDFVLPKPIDVDALRAALATVPRAPRPPAAQT